ncbi:MAG: N-terminal phage integrase SAM-like domain-containing protein [Pseudonocardiaceae bacterium]
MRLITDRTTDVPATGKHTENDVRDRHRRVITTTCQAHGAVGFTNLLVTKKNGIVVLNPHVCLGDYLEYWLREIAAHRRATTLRGYESAVRLHIIPVLGTKRREAVLFSRPLLWPSALPPANTIYSRGIAQCAQQRRTRRTHHSKRRQTRPDPYPTLQGRQRPTRQRRQNTPRGSQRNPLLSDLRARCDAWPSP